jgi:hypothetical protein
MCNTLAYGGCIPARAKGDSRTGLLNGISRCDFSNARHTGQDYRFILGV